MTLQQLKYFLVMAEVRHYTKAANRLFISQPSLSYAISELEKELGVTFFERRGNRILMTRYGEEFLPYVKEIFATLDNAKTHLHEMLNTAIGTINLGYIYSISFDFVPRMLELFYTGQGNSQIAFEFFQGLHHTLIEKLKAGIVDLLLSANPDDKTITSVPVFKQELFVVIPEDHRLAKKEEVSLAEIKNEPLISLSKTSDIRNHLVRCFERIGTKPIIAGEVAECIGMSALVRANLGIAITPLSPTFEGGKLKALRFREDEREAMYRSICLLWIKDRQLGPSAKRFRDFLLGSVGKSA